jgi:hypothetical protein
MDVTGSSLAGPLVFLEEFALLFAVSALFAIASGNIRPACRAEL